MSVNGTGNKKLKLNEESAVVEVWAEHIFELRSKKRNAYIIAIMVEELKAMGISMNVSSLKNKLQNITAKYKKEIHKIEDSSSASSEWHLFPRVHELLGQFKHEKGDELTEESIFAPKPEFIFESTSIESGSNAMSCASSPLQLSPLLDQSPLSSQPSAKKRKIDFSYTIMDLMNEANKINKEESENLQRIEKKILEIEERKLRCMEEFNTEFKEMKTVFINYLKKK